MSIVKDTFEIRVVVVPEDNMHCGQTEYYTRGVAQVKQRLLGEYQYKLVFYGWIKQ